MIQGGSTEFIPVSGGMVPRAIVPYEPLYNYIPADRIAWTAQQHKNDGFDNCLLCEMIKNKPESESLKLSSYQKVRDADVFVPFGTFKKAEPETIKKIRKNMPKQVLAKNFEVVSGQLEQKLFDLLYELKTLKCNALIAGGCLRNWTINKEEKDVDVFICENNTSEDFVVDELANTLGIDFCKISRESAEYDEEFSVYEGIIYFEGDRQTKIQLIFCYNYSSPKAFIETFDFNVCKGFAEVVVDEEGNVEWYVNVVEIMKEIDKKTLTLNLSAIEKFEWRTKRLTQRTQMMQELFPDHKIVIV